MKFQNVDIFKTFCEVFGDRLIMPASWSTLKFKHLSISRINKPVPEMFVLRLFECSCHDDSKWS